MRAPLLHHHGLCGRKAVCVTKSAQKEVGPGTADLKVRYTRLEEHVVEAQACPCYQASYMHRKRPLLLGYPRNDLAGSPGTQHRAQRTASDLRP